jgi:hypothetical protein
MNLANSRLMDWMAHVIHALLMTAVFFESYHTPLSRSCVWDYTWDRTEENVLCCSELTKSSSEPHLILNDTSSLHLHKTKEMRARRWRKLDVVFCAIRDEYARGYEMHAYFRLSVLRPTTRDFTIWWLYSNSSGAKRKAFHRDHAAAAELCV